MNKYLLFLLAAVAVSFSSCAAIGDIFKAGAWFGIVIVIIVVAIIFWVVSKVSGGGDKS